MARFTGKGPKGDTGLQGPAGNGAPTDTYDKIYTTHNSDGTNVKIGDDAWIGDVDSANRIAIIGVEDSAEGGVILGDNLTEIVSSDGTNLNIEADNDIILYPGSTYGYIGAPELDGGNRIATWDYVQTQAPVALKYGSFTSIITQTGTGNSIQPVYCEVTEFNKDITMENSSGGSTNASRIKIGTTGRYNIQFSLQMHQGNGQAVVNLWLRKNGQDVPNSNTKFDITANNPYYVAAWNFFVEASSGDYYELIWSSTSATTQVEYVDPAGAHPAVPSVILTVQQIGL